MLIYILLYLFTSILIIFIGFLVGKNYKSLSGKYLVASFIIFLIWNILYLISYTSTINTSYLLLMSRLLFSLSFQGFACIIMFLVIFNCKITKRLIIFNYLFIILMSLIFIFTLFTGVIINDMVLNTSIGMYVEQYGIFYILYFIFYILLLPISVLISMYKYNKLNTLMKIRYLFISLGLILFIFIIILFLVLLPYFNIYIFQIEITFAFIFPTLFIWYSLYRYYYLNVRLGLLSIIITIISSLITWFFTFYLYKIYNYYLYKLDKGLLLLWNNYNNFSSKELLIFFILGLIIFKLFNDFLSKLFLGNTEIQQIEKNIVKLKAEIPYISNFTDLNSFLKLKFNHIFKIKYVEVVMINDENKFEELVKYFGKEKINNIFINDIVFIEENKNKFNKNNIVSEINSESYLILPLYNNKYELVGFFNLGQKPFGDIFYSEEVDLLKEFAKYISGHLKYLRLYDRINDLNINLDKLVDKKTMEYNALVNKQKDFISFVSHEIKGPIGSSIFQVDCLIDELDDGKVNKGYMKKELELLNNQLIKIGDLTNKIFSIEKYDIGKVTLSKEKVNINDIISSELELIIKKNTNIEFIINLDDNVGYSKLDKVQMTQVITNLITNAIKFSINGNQNPKIAVSTFMRGEKIYIYIEDNGKEFEYTNIASLFEKYNTGKGSSIGLGMGLYLCKKIVEMHDGEISAENSEELSGAKFTIILPK